MNYTILHILLTCLYTTKLSLHYLSLQDILELVAEFDTDGSGSSSSSSSSNNSIVVVIVVVV